MLSEGIRDRIAEIVDASTRALEALRWGGTPAAAHAAAGACDRARDLFRRRVSGETETAPILPLLKELGRDALAEALRHLFDALQLAENWMIVTGQISRDAGEPLSFELWKDDAPASIDEGSPPLTDAEERFRDRLRGRDWSIEDSEAAVDEIGDVSRRSVGSRVVIELGQAIIAVAEFGNYLGLVVDEATRRVERVVGDDRRVVDLAEHPQLWRVFLIVHTAQARGVTKERLSQTAWDYDPGDKQLSASVGDLRSMLDSAGLGVTIGHYKRYRSYRLVESSPGT